MVTGEIAVMGAIGGTILGGIFQHQIAQYREREMNDRAYGQIYAEKEAEAMTELGEKVSEQYRFYLVHVRKAAFGRLDEEYYEDEVEGKHHEFEKALTKASIYLSEGGEDRLWDYYQSLVAANSYIEWKLLEDVELASGDEDLDNFVRRDTESSDFDFDIDRMHQQYEYAKRSLRAEMTDRIQSFVS